MPDDHSEVVPLLPIPNRTVKRLCADDSAGSRVKVGHRQAITARNAQSSDRKRQLEIVLLIGQRLAKLTRKPGLGTLLKLMRRPAATAGLESLQHFLEQGFAIFGALARSEKTVVEFLETIRARETSWIDMMFDPSSSY